MHWREPLSYEERRAVIEAYSLRENRIEYILTRWRLSRHALYSLLERAGVSLRAPGRGRVPAAEVDEALALSAISEYAGGEPVQAILERHGLAPATLYKLLDGAGVPRRAERTSRRA